MNGFLSKKSRQKGGVFIAKKIALSLLFNLNLLGCKFVLIKDLVLVQVAGPTLVPETHCSVGCCYIWSDCGQCGWPSTLRGLWLR